MDNDLPAGLVTLGREGETTWSGNNDVDDFHTLSFVDGDYTGLDAGSDDFTGLGGRVYVKYVSLNTSGSLIHLMIQLHQPITNK